MGHKEMGSSDLLDQYGINKEKVDKIMEILRNANMSSFKRASQEKVVRVMHPRKK